MGTTRTRGGGKCAEEAQEEMGLGVRKKSQKGNQNSMDVEITLK